MSIPTIVLVAFLRAVSPAPDVDALLDSIERATSEFRDFQAFLTLDRADSITEESERRIGRVLIEAAPAGRRFAVVFESFIAPDGRADESRRHFVYESGWLAEVDHERKQFVNRQIVAPGETFDPLRVGEGPLPLPIGQRKRDVLDRFEVGSAERPTTGLLRGLEGVRGLRLRPRPVPGEIEETESVDLFYDATTFLPRGIIERKANGDRTEVLLREPRLDAGLSPADLALLSIRAPDPRDGWSVDVRPWRRSDPAPVPGPAPTGVPTGAGTPDGSDR